MWFHVENAVDDATIDPILEASGVIANAVEDRHFVKAGKTFFEDNPRFLKSVHRAVSHAIGLPQYAAPLAINHAFLLYKSGPGPATRCHQDRPYWLDVEETCSMFTVWIALGDVEEEMGALTLNPETRVDPKTFFMGYRNGTMMEHQDDAYGGGGFTITLPEAAVADIEPLLKSVPMKRGDIVVFDAFEPHASTANTSEETRLSMKVVYGDPSNMTSFLTKVDGHRIGGLFSRLKSSVLGH